MIRIAVISPALILVTAAKSRDGFASELFIKIGVMVEPKEDPTVTSDVAIARRLLK